MQLLHLLAFLPLVFGAPASNPTTGCWVLDQIQTSQASGREPNNNNSTLSFQFIDPSTSTSTSCFATWPQKAQPEQYVDCSDPSFAWRFEKGEYQSISNFTLQLKHVFPLLGGDLRTTFGDAHIEAVGVGAGPGYRCVFAASGFASCGGGPIDVPFTSAVAR